MKKVVEAKKRMVAAKCLGNPLTLFLAPWRHDKKRWIHRERMGYTQKIISF
jgi:hypothetical protein